MASLLCHGELASSRPTADRLTEFYLWISIGGVLGGIFNALVAPAIFNSAVEYPLALAIACLVRRRNTSATPAASRRQDFRLAVVVAAAILGLLWLVHTLPFLSSLPAVPAIGVPALLCFAVRNRPLPFGLGIATLLIMGLGIVAAGDETLLRERSFFGVSQVRVYQPERLTLLLSATTKHGAQSPDPARRQEPLSYYYRTGPIGQVFAALPALDIPRVAIIGLGAGSLACYGKPGQQFTFYEIDPTVVRIARDPRYFTFLQLWEALRLYLRTLRESVLLAFHISNNRLDLEPTVANLARDAQLVALAQFDEKVSPDEARAGKTPSHWVVLARRWEDLRALPHSRHWHVLSAGPDTTLWTADFSNIFEAIKWR